MPQRLLRPLAALLPLLLVGCAGDVMNPAGDIALQQRDLVIVATVLMLLIIVPVMLLTGLFAWWYRAKNTEATYSPDWHHSTQLELAIWAAPLLIIIALGAVTWITTHTLDPYRPISRISAKAPLPENSKTLVVQVVALDWKWLFIYPEQGVASVNELALPTNTPVRFDISASTVMNSFYIPALAGQIYAMPAMQTQLHAVLNRPGRFEGFSANYSGAGFSGMRFTLLGGTQADFDAWVAQAKKASSTLSRAEYLRLEAPSAYQPVRHYARVADGLFDAVVNLCVDPSKMCQRDMMALDAQGGLGMGSVALLARLRYDQPRARGNTDYVTALCAAPTLTAANSSGLSPYLP